MKRVSLEISTVWGFILWSLSIFRLRLWGLFVQTDAPWGNQNCTWGRKLILHSLWEQPVVARRKTPPQVERGLRVVPKETGNFSSGVLWSVSLGGQVVLRQEDWGLEHTLVSTWISSAMAQVPRTLYCALYMYVLRRKYLQKNRVLKLRTVKIKHD